MYNFIREVAQAEQQLCNMQKASASLRQRDEMCRKKQQFSVKVPPKT